MRVQLTRTVLFMVALGAGVFLPYLSGGFEPLSIPLSRVVWMFGRFGLLLTPVGMLWLWCLRRNASQSARDWVQWMTGGICSLVAAALILVSISFGMLFAASVLAATGLITRSLLRTLRGRATARHAAVALVLAPVISLATQLAFLERAREAARLRVITNSEALIAEIESYRARHGLYPVSLFSLYGDYKPSVVGVDRYDYEQAGESYNLVFEEPSPEFGLRRFVVYNPRDQQRLTLHETDRLRLDYAGRDADNAGYTVVDALPQPHWKLFTFRS